MKHKQAFPCIVVQATKSDEVAQVYLRVSIDDVKFNQLNHDNRFMFTVEMYGKYDFVPAFVANVEPNLNKLHSANSHNDRSQ